MWRSGLTSLGIALGPIISSLGIYLLGAEGSRARSAAPVLLLAAIQCLILFCALVIIPWNIEFSVSDREIIEAYDDEASTQDAVDVFRRSIWLEAVLLGAVGAF